MAPVHGVTGADRDQAQPIDRAGRDGTIEMRREDPKTWSLTLGAGASLRITDRAPREGGPFYSCGGNLFFGLNPRRPPPR